MGLVAKLVNTLQNGSFDGVSEIEKELSSSIILQGGIPGRRVFFDGMKFSRRIHLAFPVARAHGLARRFARPSNFQF